MDRDVEQRGGYPVQFVTVNPDSTNAQVSASALSLPEGESRTLSFRLTPQPTVDVAIDPSCPNLLSLHVSCSGDTRPLRFTTSDWSQAQTVAVTASHDTRYSDRTRDNTWTAHSTNPHYDNEKATVAVTKLDDDSGPPLRFASPLSTSLSWNDKATLRVKLRSYNPQKDACRISYVSLWTYREDLVSDYEYEHPHSGEISTYYSIPKAGEYTGGVYEYAGEYSNGDQFMQIRHYQDGRGSAPDLCDDTHNQSKNCRIKPYSVGSVTKCQGGIDQWANPPEPKDQDGCNAVGNSNSWKLRRWANYSAD